MERASSVCRSALAVVLFAFLGAAMAGDAPRSPRLAINAGRVVGGFQVGGGEREAFELFSARADGGALRRLGRFHGRLAGVAATDGGAALALTRDGALARYDNDVEVLAEADSRWRMIGLAWLDGGPLALNNDGGRLFAVRLGPDGGWRQEEKALAEIDEYTSAAIAVVAGRPHIVLGTRSFDLSRGALRHLAAGDGGWRELPPLATGPVASFAAFQVGADNGPAEPESRQTLGVFALRRDVLDGGALDARAYVWRDGRWDGADLPRALAGDVSSLLAFAASGDGVDAAWLTVTPEGAFFLPSGSDPRNAAVGLTKGAEHASRNVSFWGSLLTLAGMLTLVFLYCRRSRALSRLHPARPPDMFSRAAALVADWFLAAIPMGAYHIANGDILVLPQLMATGEVHGVFLATLAGFIVFTAVSEALFGCTPGKYLAGLRVRSVMGGPPGAMRAVLRNLLRVVDMFPLPLGIPGMPGLIVALLGPARRRVGDLAAGTIVRRHLPLGKRKFLLASASPRRLELMRALGLEVRPEAMDIDEESVRGDSPEETVRLLAQAKAEAASGRATDGEVVVAADTVVVLDGEILGKPVDAADARNMLRRLAGRSHTVFTGVTVWDSLTGQGLSQTEETEVEFHPLSDGEIERYVATGDCLDKAGAYGVQSSALVRQVRGSLSNVAGLPMEKLQAILGALDA